MTLAAQPAVARLGGRAARGGVVRRLRPAAAALLAAVALILLWHGAVTLLRVPHFVMPTPAAVWDSAVLHWRQLGGALAFSLRSALAGLAAAAAVALGLAALFVLSERATRALLPLVIVVRTAPVLAIAPLLIMVFGRGLKTAITVVVVVCFFPIMVHALRGLLATRRSALELMHVCGAGWWQTFAKVRVPFALPAVFTGLRAAAASALLAAMLAEWLTGAPGLGTLVLESAADRDLGLLWAGVIASMLASIALFGATAAAERRLLDWNR